MKTEEFLATRSNVKELADRWLFDCDCKSDLRKNKQKGVLFKNNLKSWYCSHEMTTGHPTGIKIESIEHVEFQKRKEDYYLAHGIDFKKLLEKKIIDEHLNAIVAPGKIKNLVDAGERKLRFSAKGIYKKDVGGLYPILGESTTTLYIFAGEFDYYKGCLDGLTCTTKIFGENTNLTAEDIQKISRFMEIILVPDEDNPGHIARDKTLYELQAGLPGRQIGYKELSFKDSEEGKDYCDWRLIHSLENFLALPVNFLNITPETAPLVKIDDQSEEQDLVSLEKMADVKLDIYSIHPIFKEYLEQFAGNCEAPPEFIASSLLTAIAGTIGNRAILRIGHGIRPNLFTLLLGPSTFARKSSSMNIGLNPLRALSNKIKSQYIKDKDEYDIELENWLAKSRQDRGSRPIKPRDRSIIYPNDLTPEQMLEKMVDRPDGLFCFGEMGKFLARMKSSYGIGLKEVFTELYDFPDGEKYIKETKASGNVCIENPCPSLLGASTFQWLQEHLHDSDLLSGFLARFCFVVKREYPKVLVSLPLYFKATEDWIAIFDYLNSLQRIEFELCVKAREIYDQWYKKFVPEAISEAVLLHSSLGRLTDVCHKIAMINHVIDLARTDIPHPFVIQAISYERAFPWIEFFAENVKGCYQELTQRTNLKELKVLEIIRTRGRVVGKGKRQLSRSETFKNAHLTKKEGEEIIETLKIKCLLLVVVKGKHTYYQVLEN